MKGLMKGLAALTNDPHGYIQKVTEELDNLDTRAKIDPVLDNLEYIHELLEPGEQSKVSELLNVLMARYKTL